MKKLKLLALALATTIGFVGCGNKKDKEESRITNPEAEVCSFDDFQFLMFTENSQSVIRDAEGNEYLLQTDGYYYDTTGKKITTYGVGDVETAKLGGSSGAVGKSNIGNNSNNSNDGNNPVNNNGKPSEEGDVSNENVNQSTEPVTEYEDTTIADWESAKAEIMEAEGIIPTTEAPWHGQSDDLESYKADGGDSSLVSNKSYNTAINLGSSIPGVLTLNKVTNSGTCTVSGSLVLDAEAFNEYMKGIYGETQLDETGAEVPANYSTYLMEQYCSFAIIATDGVNVLNSDIQNLYFDKNYTVNFSLSLKIPEGYTPYLSIQDIPYNI